MAEAGQIDDTTAAENASQFAEWAYPVAYKAGAIRLHAGRLYRCVQAHTSQENWTPDAAASLWAEIADPSEEWPKWAQPIGAHAAYSAGAKVSPTLKRNGRPISTITYGSPGFTGGRRLRTWTL